jgi:hypothetical protein
MGGSEKSVSSSSGALGGTTEPSCAHAKDEHAEIESSSSFSAAASDRNRVLFAIDVFA